MAELLTLADVTAGYRDTVVLEHISLAIGTEEAWALLGRNGVGKTTLLLTIMGLTELRQGNIAFDGEDVTQADTHRRAQRGLGLVPQEREIFPSLTVHENLRVALRPGEWTLDRVYDLFPILAERRRLSPTALSGGQQQMCAIGRALMASPRLLLCDEISLGLAPIVIRDIYQRLPAIKAEGATIIVVEQDIAQAMAVADRVYCFQEGRMTLAGKPAELTREAIHAAYFGL